MTRLVKKHPRIIRWLHWINVPILAVMIWSGLLIYWANDVYEIQIGGFTLVKFFPAWFYDALNLRYRLAEGMAWHFAFMWLFAINGLLYVLYTAVSGEWRYLIPNRNSFREAWQVLLHDLHLSKVEPPKRKFNGAQQFAYTGVILMGAGSLMTGLAIYKPVQVAWLTNLLGGYEAARLEHFLLTIGYVLFFVVHISQVVRAGWNNFRAMATGYEVEATAEVSDTVETQLQINRLTRRSFAVGVLATWAGWRGWRWVTTQTADAGALWPLRRVLEFNEGLARNLFEPARLASTFPRDQAGTPKPNGMYGDLREPIDATAWRLHVTSAAAGNRKLELTLGDIRELERVEMVTELKCIEGWSQVVHWTGVRLSDFAAKYGLATRSGQPLDLAKRPEDILNYVSLVTPDGEYYVGLDMPSALHPQTLLCYEMNGQPLTDVHGAPLRLVIPVKYGIKHIKRIGSIEFTDIRPKDYWAERGYDWYAGH